MNPKHILASLAILNAISPDQVKDYVTGLYNVFIVSAQGEFIRECLTDAGKLDKLEQEIFNIQGDFTSKSAFALPGAIVAVTKMGSMIQELPDDFGVCP